MRFSSLRPQISLFELIRWLHTLSDCSMRVTLLKDRRENEAVVKIQDIIINFQNYKTVLESAFYYASTL